MYVTVKKIYIFICKPVYMHLAELHMRLSGCHVISVAWRYFYAKTILSVNLQFFMEKKYLKINFSAQL